MNVVEDEVMKSGRSIIIERIKNNKKIFNDKEIEIILSNQNLISKLYLLGLFDSIF